MKGADYDIVIIGAGITGLVAAIAFKKQGKKVLVIEKNSQLSNLGGGLAIWPNGTKFFDELELSNEIIKISGKPIQINYAKACGDHLCSVKVKNLIRKKRNYFLFVKRSDLVNFLFDQLDKNEVVFNQELLSVNHAIDNQEVILKDNKKIVTKIIIGCDGVNSRVREIISPGLKKEYLGHISLGGIVRNFHIKNNFILGKNFSCTSFPCANNNEYYTIMFIPKPEKHLKLIRDKTLQKKMLLGIAQEVDYIIKNIVEESFFCLNAYNLSGQGCFYKKSIFLAGDSAHAISPISGFAAGFCIEDVSIISNLLKTNSILEAGKKYNAIMHERAAALNNFSNDVFVNPLVEETEESFSDKTNFLKKNGAMPLMEKLVKFTQGYI